MNHVDALPDVTSEEERVGVEVFELLGHVADGEGRGSVDNKAGRPCWAVSYQEYYSLVQHLQRAVTTVRSDPRGSFALHSGANDMQGNGQVAGRKPAGSTTDGEEESAVT